MVGKTSFRVLNEVELEYRFALTSSYESAQQCRSIDMLGNTERIHWFTELWVSCSQSHNHSAVLALNEHHKGIIIIWRQIFDVRYYYLFYIPAGSKYQHSSRAYLRLCLHFEISSSLLLRRFGSGSSKIFSFSAVQSLHFFPIEL